MKHTHKILLLVALLAGFSAASAQDNKRMGRPPQPVFAEFDLNGDNTLTEEEYYEARNKRIAERAKEGRKMRGLANIASFADIDANGDGQVTENEFSAFLSGHMQKGH